MRMLFQSRRAGSVRVVAGMQRGRRSCRPAPPLSVLGLLLSAGTSHAQDVAPPAGDRWTVTAAPYLWTARLDGHAKVKGVKADVDVSFKDTLEDLSFAGMALLEARKGRFGFAVNPLIVSTNADSRSDGGALDTKSTTDIATMGAALFYRAAEWPIGRTEAGRPLVLAVEPLAAARPFANELALTPGSAVIDASIEPLLSTELVLLAVAVTFSTMATVSTSPTTRARWSSNRGR